MPMRKEIFESVLAKAGAKPGPDAQQVLPPGRTMTLHLGRQGASLSIPRVVALKVDEALVEVHDTKDEIFLFELEDLFAAAVSPDKKGSGGRTAGFRR